jgi:hypothetical protein
LGERTCTTAFTHTTSRNSVAAQSGLRLGSGATVRLSVSISESVTKMTPADTRILTSRFCTIPKSSKPRDATTQLISMAFAVKMASTAVLRTARLSFVLQASLTIRQLSAQVIRSKHRLTLLQTLEHRRDLRRVSRTAHTDRRDFSQLRSPVVMLYVKNVLKASGKVVSVSAVLR